MARKARPLRATFRKWSQKRLPQVDGRLYLKALNQQVTVHRDKWGIPHIYAASRHDLFLAQGFVQAQDRFWQMEMNRRAANGELSALFGPIALETDRLSRTLGFARLARKTWATLDDFSRADVEAYTAGVNAYLQTTPRLPLEFSLVQSRPDPWQPLDSLAYGRLQMWALTHGAFGELVKAQLIARLGKDKAAALFVAYPPDNPLTLPEGIEQNELRVKGVLTGPWTNPFLGKGSAAGAGRGSNAWVIAPERSATGHAILCNDMHLPVGIPSLWHVQHLHSEDGWHVTGFTQPGLPYVMAGHNEHIAWGITLAYVDCEDLFIEKMHPQNPGLYAFQEEWRPVEIVEEVIPIRGRSAHTEKVTLTHHGPVVSHLLGQEETIVLSSAALHPDVAFDGFRLLNMARNWDDFTAAIARIESPSLNILYADTDDNIGHWVTGRTPVRAQGDGTLPVPGWTGEYEWQGYIPWAEMPHALNPKRGYIVSANHRLVDERYPYFLGCVWRNGYRAQRLEQLIQSQPRITIADCQRFHLDFYHIPGMKLVSLLAGVETADPDSQLSLNLLRQWDGWLGPDSIGGTVYEIFYRRLTQALLRPHLDERFLSQLLGRGVNPYMHPVNEFYGQWLVTLYRILAGEENEWHLDAGDRKRLFVRCLAETTVVCQQRLGPDTTQWKWGRLHQVRFVHTMGIVPPLDHIFNQGPNPIGGDAHTVAQTGIRPGQPYENNGISISSRHIVDMGNVSHTWAMHVPGQSGHLASPHYGDLIEPWLKGDYFPLAWTAEEVTAVTRHTLTLTPPP